MPCNVLPRGFFENLASCLYVDPDGEIRLVIELVGTDYDLLIDYDSIQC